MRGRRGAGGAPMNLFSFQDIVTSVMGILLFVTLLMALQINVVAKAVAAAPPGESVPPAIALVDARGKLTATLRELEALRGIVERSGPQTDQEIVRRRAELDGIYQDVKSTREKVSKRYGVLAESVKDNRVLADGIKLDHEVQKLREELKESKLNRRFTYIARQDYARQPLIVEIDQHGLRFAPTPNADDTTIVPGGESGRLNQVKALIEQFPSNSYYVLFVVKPSAMTEATRDMIDEFDKTSGYKVGIDLLPENLSTLFAEGPR